MPIESERKYILFDPRSRLLNRLLQDRQFKHQRIHQLYMSNDVRIRRILDMDSAAVDHVFTYKKETEAGVCEIETPISKTDFDLLTAHAECQLTKIRCKRVAGELTLDIDFLMLAEQVYFWIAEIEWTADHDMPVRPDPILLDYLLYEVPVQDNKQYSNRRLCDVEYAQRAMAALLEKRPPAL